MQQAGDGFVCKCLLAHCRFLLPFLTCCSNYYHIHSFLTFHRSGAYHIQASLPHTASWIRQRNPSGIGASRPTQLRRRLDSFALLLAFGHLLLRLPWPCLWLVSRLRSSRAQHLPIPLRRTLPTIATMHRSLSCPIDTTGTSRVLVQVALRLSSHCARHSGTSQASQQSW